MPLLVLAISCKGQQAEEAPEAQNDPQPAPKRVEFEAVETEDVQDPGEPSQGEPVKLYVDFDGIGTMHKTFFTDTRVTRGLQKRLRGHVSGRVGILVGYSNTTGRGQIRVQIEPDHLVARLGSPDAISLSSLVPLTKSAAYYRDWVAGNFDLRIHNFDIGLDITPSKGVCKITVVGDPPPDGTEFSPCVEVDGTALCGELSEGVLRLPAAHRDAVAKCL